ncbi:Uncharacterized conserved protein [Colwellia chukchiensis]|uniref:Uncharacterized conserved protein n=1 Tax=Colwellia chukchiensis TaxID=641665 RepID=A0A1H7HGK0_9GAMM|nr:6-hydroxymethylpterin diphosphokinase MptE-like protein [Colwellia chukchiensis]SEK49409.1 Uncharacterized conserved protein [Colwellia chukchiensis]
MDVKESFLKSAFDEEYLYSINRNSFIKEPSTSVFKRIYKDKLNQENSFYLLLGTDSGLLLNYILQQEVPDDSRFLFIELPQVIAQLNNKYDLTDLPEHIKLCTLDNWQDTAADFGIELYLYKDNCKYIKSLAAIDSFLPDYNQAILSFEQDFQSVRFFTRATLAVSPFMGTQLKNICENNTPARILKDQFSHDSCVLLAGGPSLDESIDWIKSNQQHVVVMAVSRIAKKLLQVGIIPDIVVSVDPFDISFDVSKEQLCFPDSVLFIHSNNVTPLLLGQWSGKSVYMDRRYPWDVEGDDANLNSCGPTVTNTALKAAIDMGFSNILLAGVDLCFSEKGVTHASGSNEAKIGPTLGQTGKWVETYRGNIVETLVVFEQAAQGLASEAARAKKQASAVYNLSANAAKVDNISHIPLSALSFTDEQCLFQEKIAQLLPEKTSSEIVQDYNEVLNKVEKTLADVKKISILAKEALQANDKLFAEKGQESENFKYKVQMDKIERQLNSRFKKTAKFVKNFGIDKFIKSAQTDSSAEWSNEKLEQTGRLYYQAYIETCDNLINHLSSTQSRVKSRIEEHKTKANIPALLAQWRADNNLGRAKIWLDARPTVANTLTADVLEQFNHFQVEFEKIIANEDTQHLQRTKNEASLHGVRRKVITLFHQKNSAALHTLAQSLKLHKETNPAATPLYHLCLAYFFTASGEERQALENFELLPSEDILEDELQQIASIAFKVENYGLAKACLGQLATIASIYIPQYAKLLLLLGEQEAAIACYTDFLHQHPEDTYIWCSLGIFYFELGANDAAKLAFDKVIAQDSEHSQAQVYLHKINNITA